MSYNLTYLKRDTDSNVCSALAYEKQMYVYERSDWKDVLYGCLTEEEREDISQDQRCLYLHWAWNQADAYLAAKMPEYAISTLERALAVATDMNEKENGRWAENVASISDRIIILKSGNQLQDNLVKVLKNFLVEVESIDTIVEKNLSDSDYISSPVRTTK